MEFIYNTYGSDDSTDTDIVIYMHDLPKKLEDRKNLASLMGKEIGPNVNAILAKVENGIIVDCTYPKSSPESLNNSVYFTHKLHEQIHSCPILYSVKRNKILAIYKTVRILMSYLTRTEYRETIRPFMNWRNDFNLKVKLLTKIDFSKIKKFNQKNVSDIDVWKTYAFYVYQNTILLDSDIEVYTKKSCVELFPESEQFLYRYEDSDKNKFHETLRWYLMGLLELDIYCENEIIYYDGQSANMKDELPITT